MFINDVIIFGGHRIPNLFLLVGLDYCYYQLIDVSILNLSFIFYRKFCQEGYRVFVMQRDHLFDRYHDTVGVMIQMKFVRNSNVENLKSQKV